jgi:hypothetical protein
VVGDNPTETRWLASGGTATVSGAGAIADRTHPGQPHGDDAEAPCRRGRRPPRPAPALWPFYEALDQGQKVTRRPARASIATDRARLPSSPTTRPSRLTSIPCSSCTRRWWIVSWKSSTLKETWRQIPVRTADPTSAFDAPRYANRTLHATFALGIRELMRVDPVGDRPLVRARIRGVVDYSAKLGRRRRDDGELDLFTRAADEPARSSRRFERAPTRCMS